MLSDQDIERAISELPKNADTLHEHHDCVRIAYEWLDAQKKIGSKCNQIYPIKHLIERWAGRYVSQSDVEAAVYLHPDIKGSYPFYNISSRLTEPRRSRLNNISEAMTQVNYHESHDPKKYKIHE